MSFCRDASVFGPTTACLTHNGKSRAVDSRCWLTMTALCMTLSAAMADRFACRSDLCSSSLYTVERFLCSQKSVEAVTVPHHVCSARQSRGSKLFGGAQSQGDKLHRAARDIQTVCSVTKSICCWTWQYDNHARSFCIRLSPHLSSFLILRLSGTLATKLGSCSCAVRGRLKLLSMSLLGVSKCSSAEKECTAASSSTNTLCCRGAAAPMKCSPDCSFSTFCNTARRLCEVSKFDSWYKETHIPFVQVQELVCNVLNREEQDVDGCV